MKTSTAIAVGMFFGLMGGAALLVTAPRVDLPCEVTISYMGKRFIPAKPTVAYGRIIDVRKEVVLKGTGRFTASRLTCEVGLLKETGI